MSVNGVTSSVNAYQAYSPDAKKESTKVEAKETQVKEEVAATYEPTKTGGEKVTEKTSSKVANPELVAKMKADLDARTAQLRSLVEQMMGKQANTFADANDMWKFLAKGDFTVDEATKLQAQQDISEDGYWGVKQTSDRIIDFAVALAGDDKDKLGNMLDAFKEGYKQAEKIWGGELPEISKKTYDAVLEKFDKLINGEEEN